MPTAKKTAPGVVLWLRQDLRLHDHPALCAAAEAARRSGGSLTLLYIHSPEEDGDSPDSEGTSWRPGAASLVWAEQALWCLDADLQGRYGAGAAIVFRRGPYAAALRDVATATDAGSVFFSRRYEPAQQATDTRVAGELAAAGLAARGFPGFLLREPGEVRLDMGSWCGHFGTLTPFSRACQALGALPPPQPPPASLPVAATSPGPACGCVGLAGLGMVRLPRRADGSAVDWAAPIREHWRDFSEAAALQLLDRFLAKGLQRYEADRGYADGRCVSRLSPFLHWGQLSPRLMQDRLARAGGKQASKTFWRRLLWRDLAYWQLHHFPTMAARPIRPQYAAQEWAAGGAALRAWQRGATGFPLVDAAQRQLWATGWVQQNARMAAACLLTDYLNISWVEGARWYHDTLADADLAINSMMWQNAGKCGLDPWSFTVAPTSRAQDPTGAYVKRWVPELAALPDKWVHEPWRAPPEALAAAGVELGRTYPHRIADRSLQELRAESVAALRAAREAAGPSWQDAGGYDVIEVPPGATVGHDGQRMRVYTPVAKLPRGTGGAGNGSGGGPQRRRATARAARQRPAPSAAAGAPSALRRSARCCS